MQAAPFSDILVPLDGSPIAERALQPALELVPRTGVPLRVLRRAFAEEAETAAAYLADVADRHAGVTDVETQVLDRDSVPDAIRGGLGADTLVCMSSHGRGGVARALMGSVAESVLRTLGRPVLVVGPHLGEAVTFTGRVIACLDGSTASEGALDPAHAWAQTLGLPLWLIQVDVPSTPVEWMTQGGTTGSAPLARLARRLGDVDGWDTYHSRHPARELADLSASSYQPTALLVMATHGRTGWDRLRLGSVTAATVHAATVPVLVVPARLPELVGTAGAEHEGVDEP